MDLRFHPRTEAQKELRFVPREKGCGYPGHTPPRPRPKTISFGMGYGLQVSGGIPRGRVTQLFGEVSYVWSPYVPLQGCGSSPLPEAPPPPPLATWDEPSGDLFD